MGAGTAWVVLQMRSTSMKWTPCYKMAPQTWMDSWKESDQVGHVSLPSCGAA